uniref:UPF0251 protein ENV67_05010 n=1 Tax=candidate division WOR-3 bacterium TaxID=2052148 RepID=A0A7C4YA10_UNCW3
MPRPSKCRRIFIKPHCRHFSPENPKGEIVFLTLDELEAIRLADMEGLYQEDAAKFMNISRQTFGNILSSAHKKIAESLIGGKIIKIEGGNVNIEKEGTFTRVRRKHICLKGGFMNQRRMGQEGYCVCPKCGFRKEHQAGLPCREERCPHCNIPMVREGSYHHQLIEKNKGKKGGKDV